MGRTGLVGECFCAKISLQPAGGGGYSVSMAQRLVLQQPCELPWDMPQNCGAKRPALSACGEVQHLVVRDEANPLYLVESLPEGDANETHLHFCVIPASVIVFVK